MSTSLKMRWLFSMFWMLFMHWSFRIRGVAADCYFPPEFQGVYEVQASVDALGQISYDRLTISPTDISVWGRCHVMDGPYAIMHISTNAGECYRCFHIASRTPNILQVNTDGLEKCYTSVEVARRKCPQPSRFRGGEGIFLWKVNGNMPGKNQQRQFCPLDGRYTVSYALSGHVFCNDTSDTIPSILTNCPHGDIMNIDFKNCTFTPRKTEFRCLGSWQAENGQKFIGLMEQRSDTYVKFRCAMYSDDPDGSNKVYVALSPDSGCETDLNSSRSGFESLILTPAPYKTLQQNTPGNMVKPQDERETCHFPSWMQGQWFDATHVRGNEMTFRDGVNGGEFPSRTSYRSTCVYREQLNVYEEKIQTFVQTQCGEEMYTCLWIKRRAPNVFEMKVGTTAKSSGLALCQDKSFARSRRITIGRNPEVVGACPFSGELLARLSEDKCARISTPCPVASHIDYIQTNCKEGNLQEVYDRRQYSCTASWKQDNINFIYATRLDMSHGRYCLAANITDDSVQMLAFKDNCQYDKSPLYDGVHFQRISECSGTDLISPSAYLTSLVQQQNQQLLDGQNEVPGASSAFQPRPPFATLRAEQQHSSGWQAESPNETKKPTKIRSTGRLLGHTEGTATDSATSVFCASSLVMLSFCLIFLKVSSSSDFAALPSLIFDSILSARNHCEGFLLLSLATILFLSPSSSSSTTEHKTNRCTHRRKNEPILRG